MFAVCRLTAVAMFIGHVCRASVDMEITALLQYLVNQLRDKQSHDLVVLKELISTMTVCRTQLQHRNSMHAVPRSAEFCCTHCQVLQLHG